MSQHAAILLSTLTDPELAQIIAGRAYWVHEYRIAHEGGRLLHFEQLLEEAESERYGRSDPSAPSPRNAYTCEASELAEARAELIPGSPS